MKPRPPAVRSWMLTQCMEDLKRKDCPTDPVSVRSRACPECGRLCPMHWGVHGGQWFLAHPVIAGASGCKHEMRTWRGKTKEEADAAFEQFFNL